jgi:hypothetical protein
MDVITKVSYSIQVSGSRLLNFDPSIKPNFYFAAFWGHHSFTFVHSHCCPIAILVVVLLHNTNPFVQGSLQLNFGEILHVSQIMDVYLQTIDFVIWVLV